MRRLREFSCLICLVVVFIMTCMQTAFAAGVTDKIFILGDINTNESAHGSLITIVGNINAKNAVQGDIVAIVGNIYVESQVNGDVVAVLGTVTLGENAKVMGDVVAIGPNGVRQAPGARIDGDVVSVEYGNWRELPFKAENKIFPILGSFNILHIFIHISVYVLLLIGLLVTVAAEDKVKYISMHFEENIIRKIVLGISASFVFIIAMPLLVITIIGLPIVLICYVVAGLMGLSSLNIYLGQKVLDLINNKSNIYGEYSIGAILIAITLTSIHYSGLIALILWIVSLGIGLDAWIHKPTL